MDKRGRAILRADMPPEFWPLIPRLWGVDQLAFAIVTRLGAIFHERLTDEERRRRIRQLAADLPGCARALTKAGVALGRRIPPAEADAWLRRQLEGLGKEGT